MPPPTTKRRTTNLKTKNNQNWQIIELYGSLDNQKVKEETFIQTSKRGRDGQPRRRGLVAKWWLVDLGRPGGGWQVGHFHIHVQINWEEKQWSETDCSTKGSRMGK